MTEAEIRDSIVAKLTASREGCGAAFIKEMFIDKFSRRADLVMANGKLSVFEIKSERDSLSRLEGQLDSYCRYFEKVTVVCAERHLAGVLSLASADVGIWSVRRDGAISMVRRARSKKLPTGDIWLSFLPVDEIRYFLKKNNLKSSGLRDDLIECAKQIPVREIREFVLSYLKRREEKIRGLIEKQANTVELAHVSSKDEENRLRDFLSRSMEAQVAIPRSRNYSSSKPSISSSS
jgi:hypothetical protein